MKFLVRGYMGCVLLLGAAPTSSLAIGGEWVDQQGCYCGGFSTVPVSFALKGDAAGDETAGILDQFEYWNSYADIFVASQGSGSAGLDNGVNEVAIFLSATEQLEKYGFALNPAVAARTVFSPVSAFGDFDSCSDFVATDCAAFTEVDLVLNGDLTRGWTTDLEDYDANLLQATVLHELGHVWGGHHVFELSAWENAFSVLNYMPDDVGVHVARMDANTLRAAYPARSLDILDIGIFPFSYGNGQYAQTYTDASPFIFVSGEVVYVRNLLIQNIGTQTAGETTVTYYLSADRSLGEGDVKLGTATFSSFVVSREEVLNVALPVPQDILPGDYFLGASVTVEGQEDGITRNNRILVGSPLQIQLRAGENLLDDGGFEDGSVASGWSNYSSNYTTPICDASSCGSDTGSGPRTDDYWVWFGGARREEVGHIQQSLTIPSVPLAELVFYLEIPDNDNVGHMAVTLDDAEVFRATQQDAEAFDRYRRIAIDVTAYADGGEHVLRFYSLTQEGGGTTNFFVDDISILTWNEKGQCNEQPVTLVDTVFPYGQVRYTSETSVATHGDVELKSGGGLYIEAPMIRLEDGFHAAMGSSFVAKGVSTTCVVD